MRLLLGGERLRRPRLLVPQPLLGRCGRRLRRLVRRGQLLQLRQQLVLLLLWKKKAAAAAAGKPVRGQRSLLIL